MAKVTKKNIPLDKLYSSDSVNGRCADNYDLDSLIPQITLRGRIINPLVVEAQPDGMYLVLRGNRRLRAAKIIVADPSQPAEMIAALAKLSCEVYEDLTHTEREDLIFDDGETKPLNREETILAVWRLYKQFSRPEDIMARLYHMLARYSNNVKKLAELNRMPKGDPKRKKYMATWFAGTLRAYMLAGASMTDEVREAMILTARFEDGRLKDEVVPFLTSQDKIAELSKARTKDEAALGWTVEAGGEAYNETLQRFKDEHAGKATAPEKKKAPSPKDLKGRIASFKSAALRAAFGVASGDEGAGVALLTMDDAIHRSGLVFDVIGKAIPSVTDKDVKTLLLTIVGSGPAADVEAALAPFCK